MSADPESSAPRPHHGPHSTVREKLPIPPVKRRHKKGSGPEGEPAPQSPVPGVEGGGASTVPEDDPLLAEIDELSARVQALRLKSMAAQRAVQANRGAKYHRLARRYHPPEPGTPRDPDAPAPSAADPVTLPAPSAIRYAPWHDTTWRPGWVVGTIGVLAVGLVTFYLGQTSIQRTPLFKEVRPTHEPTWTAGQISQIDGLFAADRAGNPAAAFQQAELFDGQLGGRNRLSLEAAVWRARAGNLNEAEADLVRLENASPPLLMSSLVQDRLGFIAARRRDFLTAAASFSDAAAANPFDPLIFYHWGESLRRGGQLAEAIGKFQLALQRLPANQPESSSLRECAGLRLRLTQIELGNDADLKSSLDEQLRQPAPSVYWLLTQVAFCLQHGDRRGAAAALEQARAAIPLDQFELLTNDYFLRQLGFHKSEVAALVPEMTPARRARLEASTAYFIDP